MTLLEIFEKIASLNGDLTIYAVKPWTPESSAMLVHDPDAQRPAEEATRAGMSVFLEVFTVQDLLEDWDASAVVKPTVRQQCERFIRYATDDA